MSAFDDNVYNMIHNLKENYVFEYTFTEKELKEYGFSENQGIQWPLKPIAFASGKSADVLSVMAFGGCIGLISFGKKKCFNKEEKKAVKSFAKYLSPKDEGEIYYKDEHGHIVMLPERFMKKYSNDGKTKIESLLEKGYTMHELLKNKEYLDLMVCAAYVRFMHREFLKGKKGEENRTTVMRDVSERSMQTMIARENMDNAGKQRMVVIDVEYKEELAGTNPSVDFVVFDKEKNSFGLVEFKYQGKSMDPSADNSLTKHFKDFIIMTTDATVKHRIVKKLIVHMNKIIEYKIIDDEEAKAALKELEEKCKGENLPEDILWCGFYFVDAMDKMTSRDKCKMKMKNRIEYDCKKQIVEIEEFKESLKQIDVRYQHSDIKEKKELVMKDELLQSVME